MDISNWLSSLAIAISLWALLSQKSNSDESRHGEIESIRGTILSRLSGLRSRVLNIKLLIDKDALECEKIEQPHYREEAAKALASMKKTANFHEQSINTHLESMKEFDSAKRNNRRALFALRSASTSLSILEGSIIDWEVGATNNSIALQHVLIAQSAGSQNR